MQRRDVLKALVALTPGGTAGCARTGEALPGPGAAPEIPPAADDLRDAVDLHCHTAPDAVPRSIDDVTLARLASAAGMRAIVLKSHARSTAARARIVRDAVPGVEVLGGVTLNHSAGGLDPGVVDRMVADGAGAGRFVWLPTRDAVTEGGALAVARDGGIVPALGAVLDRVAALDLVLATGHSAPDDTLLVLDAARARGLRRILVTHPMSSPVRASLEHLRAFAARGALLEATYFSIVSRELAPGDIAAAILAVGPRPFVITSDMGQPGNPLHTDGLAAFARALETRGVGRAAIDLMMRRNPARLLRLPT